MKVIDEVKRDLAKLTLEEFAEKYGVKPIKLKLKVGEAVKIDNFYIKKTEDGLEITVMERGESRERRF